MATRRLGARGRAAPALAWERYERIALWPTWSPQIRRAAADADRIAPGVRGTVHVPGGLGLPFTVTAVDRAAFSWSWAVRLGPVTLRMRHEVRPAPDGCETVLVMDGPGPVLVAYSPGARVALRRLVTA